MKHLFLVLSVLSAISCSNAETRYWAQCRDPETGGILATDYCLEVGSELGIDTPTYGYYELSHILVVDQADYEQAITECQANPDCMDVMTLDQLPKREDAK